MQKQRNLEMASPRDYPFKRHAVDFHTAPSIRIILLTLTKVTTYAQQQCRQPTYMTRNKRDTSIHQPEFPSNFLKFSSMVSVWLFAPSDLHL